MTYLEKAIKDGYALITENANKQRITYITSENHVENYNDPEEQVRAEFWAELIYKYDYPVNRIKIEVVIPDRLPTDRADIVIFRDDECKRPYAVVECKKDGVTDAEFNQAIEQGVGNATWVKLRAEYVVIIAGGTRRILDVTDKFGALERELNILADLPKAYGKPQEFRFYKGGVNEKGEEASDIKPVDREDLIRAIKKCHQTLWGGGRLSPPTAFGELCKIIFVKISDEQKARKKGEPYQFQIKTHEPSSKLAARIRELYDKQKINDPEVFTESIKVDDRVLRTVVSHLEGINLNKTDLDVKGVAFEQFMDGFFKGDFGQYFTPRPIIEFAVQMMEPEHNWDVLDSSCGSGGFLLHALDYMRNQAAEYYEKGSVEYYTYWHDFASKHLYGIEINDEIARVAKMNMIVHDDGHTNVISADALDSIDLMYQHNRGFKKNKFDLVLTNPPFGSTINHAEKPYLSGYFLGKTYDAKGKAKPRKNQSSEVLFIERIWEFLKPGTGKAAIILPDGILTNSSMQYVRDFILEKFQLLAVVSLPQHAFTHFGAGVKASIIFVRKRRDNELIDDNEAIFMASPELIGYDATGKTISVNQLFDVCTDYLSNNNIGFKFKIGYLISRRDIINSITKRLDPKCYNKDFIVLKEKLQNSKVKKYLLKDLILENIGGDWGDEVDILSETKDKIKCLVLRATEISNKYNIVINEKKAQYRAIDVKKYEKMNLEKGDIIIEKSGGSKDQPVGRVVIIEETTYNDIPIAYSNFLTKIKVNRALVDPYYLFEYLRYIYSIGLTEVMQNQTNGIRNLIMSEYLSQTIVVPDNNKEIGEKIKAERQHAKDLEEKSNKILSSLKFHFEKELLGEQ